MSTFKLSSPFQPTGDQPQAIKMLVENLNKGIHEQTLLGVTGSGKTFTAANVIAQTGLPTLVISHNKTLAAQLYEELKSFFPENTVHYFVSYYDYYQPEAYIPQSDTYIEKDAKINELIDSLRHASTASLLMRDDVIIVASVSCIYGIGSPDEYEHAAKELAVGMPLVPKDLIKSLVTLQYVKNPLDPRQGHFRTRENTVEIYLPSGEDIISVAFENRVISSITLQKRHNHNEKKQSIEKIKIFPAKHFVTPQEKLTQAVRQIRQELKSHLQYLKKENKILEAARLKQRTEFDLEMLESTGYVNGIENYSRHLDFRAQGSPPHTLIDFFLKRFGKKFLTIIDESHATIPQIRGMYFGDRARKQTLVNYGFRLPSAIDNRPLTFDEFNKKVGQILYLSATPSPYEINQSKPHIVEQVIRPTSILDPILYIRPTAHQVKDVIKEIKTCVQKNERSLVMALTKRLAEDIAGYLKEAGIRAEYLHSEIKTLDRPEILKKLRTGEHDVIVGINLLREGLDLPEVSFIAILDADKEGFLRNETTLLQIIGRAARHTDGTVVLYADTITGSMKAAIHETDRRRKMQNEYNKAHGLTPKDIKTEIRSTLISKDAEIPVFSKNTSIQAIISTLEKEMKKAAKALDFERAARIRNQIEKLSEN